MNICKLEHDRLNLIARQDFLSCFFTNKFY